MKDYSYKKCKMVYLKNSKKYTANAKGTEQTEDMLQANQWLVTLDDEKILGFLLENVREEAQIVEAIISIFIYEHDKAVLL